MKSINEQADDLPALNILQMEFQGYTGNLPACIYRPKQHRNQSVLPIFLYFHGGGFVGGSIQDADIPARFIAQHCPAIVMSAGYSLAPVYPFPNAPEDAYAAFTWIRKNATSLGGSPDLIAVGGDDAGGNLATCLSFIARDRHAGPVDAQVLIAPMLDPSMTRLDNTPGLDSSITAGTCASCYSQYLPQTMQRMHPYAAPLESRRLKGMPRTLIITAEQDLLHIEAEKYAGALIDAGVPTQFIRYAAVTHAGLSSHGPALAEIAGFLRRHLGTRPDLSLLKYTSLGTS